VLYPLAIMMIWLPCVFLGVLGFAALGKVSDPDGILLLMLEQYAPAWLAGILGAGIISAVMGSDAHQVLALSTMFTKDIYQHYGGAKKFGERGAVLFARIFIVLITAAAFLVALKLKDKQGIFEIAVRYAFSGFAAMAPVMVAALFWKRSTKWGALASTLFVGATLILFGALQGPSTPPPAAPAKPAPAAVAAANTNNVPSTATGTNVPAPVASTPAVTPETAAVTNKVIAPSIPAVPAGKPKNVIWQIGQGKDAIQVLTLAPNGDVRFFGFLTVVPMVLGSALCMILFSLITPPPSEKTIEKYFHFPKT